MNEHIHTDNEEPAVSLVSETLSDKSTVWNIILRSKEIGCMNEARARKAMVAIAEALTEAACGEIRHT